MSLVRIILGSKSDLSIGEDIKSMLDQFKVPYDFHISSAHRKPEQTMKLAQSAQSDGIKVIIAVAGMAAHLPGVVASHTTLPVIGVPVKGATLAGEDALYAIVQMPTGIPVATVAINGGKNAAILACQILGTSMPKYSQLLQEYKEELANA
ncbi:MAG: 5-(carboxyamino)imidazole ribonucleotide mutase [Candidatus Cloacimonas sp.]|jgi:5-(carboxyamino)imidazole ribonucleotide mutase|nr:5-(carboxyamino)imidazole ribonucleotide mutase [Candidatus Cloacimonadota bacterium]